jgi:DNA-binding MarR family transcriptional regulator
MRVRSATLQTFTWELRRAFRDLAEAADKALEPLGLTVGDRAMLEFLAREDRPVSMVALARTYAVSRQHIHQSMRRPPLDALIEEYADPDDRRSVLITLNSKGRGVWKRIQSADGAFFAALAPGFTQEEIQQAHQVLRKLRATLLGRKEPDHDHR